MGSRYISGSMITEGRQAAAAGKPAAACPYHVLSFTLAWQAGWNKWHKDNPLFAAAPTTPAQLPTRSPGQLPIPAGQ